MVNLTSGEKNTIKPEKNGDFLLIASSGAKYDISIRDTDGKYLFVSRLDDLQNIKKSTREKWSIELKPIQKGMEATLGGVSFKTFTSKLTEESNKDLNRLLFLLKKNPNLKLEIGVHVPEIKTGKRKTKELTEEVRKMITIQKEIEVIDSIMKDTVITRQFMIDSSIVDSTWKQTVKVAVKSTKIIDEQVEQITYHNNRTSKQAESIFNFFTTKGVPVSKIKVVGHGDEKNKFSEDNGKNVLVDVKFR